MLVTDAMRTYYEHQVATENDNWDPTTLHSSDLSFCVTKIWARRNGLTTKYIDLDNRRQMAFGKLWEIEMAAILRHAGIEFTEQVEVKGEIAGVEVECHGDFDIPSHDLYLETKTTEYWKGWKDKVPYYKIPEKPKPYHLMQAAATAILLDRSNFTVSDTGRNNGGHAEFTYQTAEYRDQVESAVLERADTRPGDPEPLKNEPVFEWECKTCAYAACVNNKNPFLQVIN